MTGRSRALLINALVFPGMGQVLVLGRRWVGGLLIAGSLAALLAYGVFLLQALNAAVLSLPPERFVEHPGELVRTILAVVRHPDGGALIALLALLVFWLLALLEALRRPAPTATSRRSR